MCEESRNYSIYIYYTELYCPTSRHYNEKYVSHDAYIEIYLRLQNLFFFRDCSSRLHKSCTNMPSRYNI